jgi:hypothetical protein
MIKARTQPVSGNDCHLLKKFDHPLSLVFRCGPPLRSCSETNSQLQQLPNNEREDIMVS